MGPICLVGHNRIAHDKRVRPISRYVPRTSHSLDILMQYLAICDRHNVT